MLKHRSDAELVDEAFEGMCDLEGDLVEIRDYARALQFVSYSLTEPGDAKLSSVIYRLGKIIEDVQDTIETDRAALFRRLHPRRHEPGFPDNLGDDGNGDVEPAAGDAA